MKLKDIKVDYKNAYYRATWTYIAVLVTLIFGFQMYRYFVAAPSAEIRKDCGHAVSAIQLVPVIGVLFDG